MMSPRLTRQTHRFSCAAILNLSMVGLHAFVFSPTLMPMRKVPLLGQAGRPFSSAGMCPRQHTQCRTVMSTTPVGRFALAKDVKRIPRHVTEEHDIFCNRELAMKQIKAIGFDMDYTLAQYQSTFDLLAFEGAKHKLVHDMGYPQEVLQIKYDPEHFTRGLVIDRALGNIIKMDRHKYVRVAFHGTRKLDSDERKNIYQTSFEQAPTYSGPNYVNMDTLFSLVDAVLFAHLVDLKDKDPQDFPQKTYTQIFKEIRICVDLCHRDGVIKDQVALQPQDYIVQDPDMVPMLKSFRDSGMKVFLLTNSLWDYTNVVMNFLYGNDVSSRSTEWLDLFDAVVVGACKPAYLTDPGLNLFRVNTEEDTLKNTDGVTSSDGFLRGGKVFQGGNWQHLHDMLDVTGDEVLYVGDHMFSDILRSKRTLGWRTCLIVPELENEIRVHRKHGAKRRHIDGLRTLQYDLDEWCDRLRLQVEAGGPELGKLREELERLLAESVELKGVLREESLDFHHLFHPAWGQLFKSGYQDSRFSKQVTTYACVYTSRASNLRQVSPQRSFRPVKDLSPHDQLLETGEEREGTAGELQDAIWNARSAGPSAEGP